MAGDDVIAGSVGVDDGEGPVAVAAVTAERERDVEHKLRAVRRQRPGVADGGDLPAAAAGISPEPEWNPS